MSSLKMKDGVKKLDGSKGYSKAEVQQDPGHGLREIRPLDSKLVQTFPEQRKGGRQYE